MAELADAVDEIEGPGGDEGVPLRTLGDVEREMEKVYRAMRKKRITTERGNGLTQTLTNLASIKQDARDSRWLPRVKELWRDREAAKAPKPVEPAVPH